MLEEWFFWAYERHQNVLSWYIRPLFLLPFCYFAYRRSHKGIAAVLLLLLSSMYWFPKPAVINPHVRQFLQMEQDYLLGQWNLAKILMTLLVPGSLAALAYAFWKRSWLYGLLVLNLIAVLKIVWSIYFGGDSGFAVVAPALTGLVLCNAVIAAALYWLRKKKQQPRQY